MLVKLAALNVRRSVRDYWLYFATLTLAVSMFYTFNSINDQQFMVRLRDSTNARVMELLPGMMALFSALIVFVLAFLVIYANRTVISRRKREFGTYLLLGMSLRKVSSILLLEAFFVGLAALAGGLVLGIGLSQFVGLASAAAFGIMMPDWTFEFSSGACTLTLVCFAAIFALVALFNVTTLRHVSLKNLIYARELNEKQVVKRPVLNCALFLVALAMLGVAYWQLKLNGMSFEFDEHFGTATVLMLAGTLLLFFSLGGLVSAVVPHLQSFYLRGLRPFELRQVTSKINTSFASMWAVCILLFFALVTFSTGFGLIQALVGDVDAANPYDASIISGADAALLGQSDELSSASDAGSTANRRPQTLAILEERVSEWSSLVKSAQEIEVYTLPNVTYGTIMDALDASTGFANSDASIYNQPVQVVSASQFNAQRALVGLDAIELKPDEYLVASNTNVAAPIAEAIVREHYALQVDGTAHLYPLDFVDPMQLCDFTVKTTSCVLVVPDSVIASLVASGATPYLVFTNIMFTPDSNANQTFKTRIVESAAPGITNIITRQEMLDQGLGLSMLVSYLALYLGIVLLICTAAVLAIQIITHISDSSARYTTLSKLGCDAPMIHRTLKVQVALYFLAPLVVAACHAGYCIALMQSSLIAQLGRGLLEPMLITCAFVVVIYGIYLLLTYGAGKSILKAFL